MNGPTTSTNSPVSTTSEPAPVPVTAVKLITDDQLTLLEEAMVMTKLSGRGEVVHYSMQDKERIAVVVCGVPLDYRMFCLLATRAGGGHGGFTSEAVEKEIKDFWINVGFDPKLDEEKEGPAVTLNLNGFKVNVASRAYSISAGTKAIEAIREAARNCNVVLTSNHTSDLLPLMQEVSMQLKTTA